MAMRPGFSLENMLATRSETTIVPFKVYVDSHEVDAMPAKATAANLKIEKDDGMIKTRECGRAKVHCGQRHFPREVLLHRLEDNP